MVAGTTGAGNILTVRAFRNSKVSPVPSSSCARAADGESPARAPFERRVSAIVER
jgi:hypothetical protein